MADTNLVELTAAITAAFVENNRVAPAALPDIIASIHGALLMAESGDQPDDHTEKEPALSRAQIRKSITPTALISFEDGRPYKALKRHLATRGMTPAEYRQKWGLPNDYPMVAASYSEARSRLAIEAGLGQKRQVKPANAKVAKTNRGPGRPRKNA